MRVERHTAYEEQTPVDVAIAAAMGELAISIHDEDGGEKMSVAYRRAQNKPEEREWTKIEMYLQGRENGVRAIVHYEEPLFENMQPTAELYLLSKGETLTFPYRHIDLLLLPDIMKRKRLGNLRMRDYPAIVKPTKAISIDEATTLKGMERIREFFFIGFEQQGEDSENQESFAYQRSEIERIRREGEGDFFVLNKWEEEDENEEPITDENGNAIVHAELGSSYISPAILSEATGEAYGSFPEYVSGISRLLKRDLTPEEVKTLEFPYYDAQAEAYLSYCLYSFLFSERYADLQEAVAQYSRFGLPDDWETQRDIKIIMDGDSPIEWVLQQYYYADSRMGVEHSIKEVADYTGAPYKLLLRLTEQDRFSRVCRNK